MSATSAIELKGLEMAAEIGTFPPGESRPKAHLLDLTLTVDAGLVLIENDGMEHVFDYDPLLLEIDRLARDRHYETQERLITRIVDACARHSEIKALEVSLRKVPTMLGSGSLGVRVQLDEAALVERRPG